MTWASPSRLWLLLGVVALLVVYVVMQRRRSRYAVRFTNLSLLDRVAPHRPRWRRHVPAALFLAMLALLVAGFARPQDDVRVPRERATVIVAVDVSRSMLAADVSPDRLTAAKNAAREFVRNLPATFNVGLVAFAGDASVSVPPSLDRTALVSGIDRLRGDGAGRGGTAIGEAIATSLDQIRGVDGAAAENPPPARVVVLSDGANTSGRDPSTASASASELGVPVDAISFGTASGTIDGGGSGGGAQSVPVDGATLQSVARTTGGHYFEAGDAGELRDAYSDIGSSIGYRTERQDVSARFIGAGLVFAVAAAALSLLWFARLP